VTEHIQRDLVTVTQLAREIGIAPQTVQGVVKDLAGVTMNGRNVYWRDDVQAAFAYKNSKLLEFLGYTASPAWAVDAS
jgi:uncharacterized membrane protein YcfT